MIFNDDPTATSVDDFLTMIGLKVLLAVVIKVGCLFIPNADFINIKLHENLICAINDQ